MRAPPPDWLLTHVVVDDAVLAKNDPQAIMDPVWWVADFYESYEVMEETLAPFTWPQRLIWAVLWFEAEVCNGGLARFFSNSTGMIWPEALEGFEAIGRADLAAIVKEAAARFPSPPARDRALREDALDLMDADFADLDDRYYASHDDLFDAVMAYIREQPDAFYFDGYIHMPPPKRDT